MEAWLGTRTAAGSALVVALCVPPCPLWVHLARIWAWKQTQADIRIAEICMPGAAGRWRRMKGHEPARELGGGGENVESLEGSTEAQADVH